MTLLSGVLLPSPAYALVGKAGVWPSAAVKPNPGPGYLAGEFPDGITSILGTPEPATIRVLYRPTGVLVAEVASAADGTWRVDGLDPTLKFDVICRKTGYNDLIWADVSPSQYPPLTFSGSFAPDDQTTFVLTGALTVAGAQGALRVEVSGDSPPGIWFSISAGAVVANGRCYTPGAYTWSIKVIDGRHNVGQITCTATMAQLWVPSRLAAAPQLWVDDQTQVTVDSANKVSLWADRSGNAWHFSQATAASQPLALPNELGGQRVVRFDGTDDSLATSAAAALNLFRNQAKGWVFSVVKRRGAGNATSAMFSVPRGGSTSGIRFGVYDSLTTTSKPGVGGRQLDTDSFNSYASANTRQDAWYLRLDILEWDNRTATLWLDGALDGQSTGLWTAAGNSQDTASGGPLSLGAAYTASGFTAELFSNTDIAALLAGTGALTSDEINKLFGWAAWYFGLTARLPSGHPYKSAKPTI